MTKRTGKLVFIEKQAPAKCDLCGKMDELRPYGPRGENICFDCGMKDETTTTKKYAEFIGKRTVVYRIP